MAHEWIFSGQWTVCKKCGIVKRADDKNRPCQGIVRIGLREQPPQTTED